MVLCSKIRSMLGALLFVLPLTVVVSGRALAADPSLLSPPAGYPERVLGRADAPVTIVEYSSFTCGHCATFNNETLPKIKKEFIDTGKVKVVYRDFPLDQVSMAGAMITRSVAEPMYFKLTDVLFSQQGTWIRASNPLDSIKQYARLAGASDETISSALKNEVLFKAVQDVQKEAEEKWGIDATPSFVIGGKVIKGAQSYETFAQEINALLPKQ